MSENYSLDGSECKSSQQSDEMNADINYSENENETAEEVSTESGDDNKSEQSQTDNYTNASSSSSSSSDVVIQQIEQLVTKEKDFMEYNGVIDNISAIQKPATLQRTCCKSPYRNRFRKLGK